jgi:2-aminoadipate transaminase
MRLNFSGVHDDDIREGVRRIGEVVREQVELFSTLTGQGGQTPMSDPVPAPRDDELADVLHLRRAGRGNERRRRAEP